MQVSDRDVAFLVLFTIGHAEDPAAPSLGEGISMEHAQLGR